MVKEGSGNLKLPYMMPSRAQKHVTHKNAIRAPDALVQLSLLGRDLSTPPGVAAEVDRHIVGARAEGANFLPGMRLSRGPLEGSMYRIRF